MKKRYLSTVSGCEAIEINSVARFSSKRTLSRRTFLGKGSKGAAGAVAGFVGALSEVPEPVPVSPWQGPRLAYLSGASCGDWDIQTLIRNCQSSGFDGVECNAGAHGLTLNMPDRICREIRLRFDNTPLAWLGLNTGIPISLSDPESATSTLALARRYLDLAARLNARGITIMLSADGAVDALAVRFLSEFGIRAREQDQTVRLAFEGGATDLFETVDQIPELKNGALRWRLPFGIDSIADHEQMLHRAEFKISSGCSREGMGKLVRSSYHLHTLLKEKRYEGWIVSAVPCEPADRLEHMSAQGTLLDDFRSGRFETAS